MVTVYILKLSFEKYYVGATDKLKPIEEYIISPDCEWTKLYLPMEIFDTYENCDEFDLDKYTVKTMAKCGIDNVRGGSFLNIKLTYAQRDLLIDMIKEPLNMCIMCGSEMHSIKECPVDKEKYTYDLKHLLSATAKNYSQSTVSTSVNNFFKVGFAIGKGIGQSIAQTVNGDIKPEKAKAELTQGVKNVANSTVNMLGTTYTMAKNSSVGSMVNGFIKSTLNKVERNIHTYCKRCGKEGHYISECTSTIDSSGKQIIDESNWICAFCDKTFSTQSLTESHEIICPNNHETTVLVKDHVLFKSPTISVSTDKK
jgi:ferredoxin